METETEYSVYQVELAIIRKRLLQCLYGGVGGSTALHVPTSPQDAVGIRTLVHQVENLLETYRGLTEQVESENKGYRKALEYYAERRHLTEFGVEQGDIARKALES